MPLVGLAVGRPSLSWDTLKDIKELGFLIFMSKLFHSSMVDGKKGCLKIFVLQ